MTPEALPTSPAAGGIYLFLILLGFAAWGLIHARVWSWVPCWRCGGRGRLGAPGNSRAWRDCPRCGSSGKRRRTFSGGDR
jgi:hypothetical protein